VTKNLFIRNYLALITIYVRQLLNFINIGNPSNLKKRRLIVNSATDRGIKTLIETGTYFGHSTIFFSKKFNKVITIEISKGLFDFTSKKFINHQNIHNFLGDSSVVMKDLLDELDAPAVFFLDGHASGGVTESGELPSPIEKELKILSSFNYLQNSIVFIDDAVGFDGTNSYPRYEEIERWCLQNGFDKPRIELEMIIICPKTQDTQKKFSNS